MANVKVRNASIFAGNKKVAEFENVTYTISAGDEPQFGDVDGGFITYSDGSVTTKLSATGVVPVPGMTYDYTSQLMIHNDVDVGIALINGHIHQITMRVLSAEFDSDVKSGTLKGKFELGGGQPRIT